MNSCQPRSKYPGGELTEGMTESVWVVMSVEGDRFDVIAVADSEEQADEIGANSGMYYSSEHYEVAHRT